MANQQKLIRGARHFEKQLLMLGALRCSFDQLKGHLGATIPAISHGQFANSLLLGLSSTDTLEF